MATYITWLREQIGRNDYPGQLAKAIKAQTEQPRQHTPLGIEKWLKAHPEIDTTWAMDRHAYAVGEYKKNRGEIQLVPEVGEENEAQVAQPPQPPQTGDAPGEAKTIDLVWELLTDVYAEVRALRTYVGAPEPADWYHLASAADFAALNAGEATPEPVADAAALADLSACSQEELFAEASRGNPEAQRLYLERFYQQAEGQQP